MTRRIDPTTAIEILRQELRQMNYTRLSDAEVSRYRERNSEIRANDAIEGLVNPVGEDFYDMLLDERVPLALYGAMLEKFHKLTLS
jgi:hypothetical protein